MEGKVADYLSHGLGEPVSDFGAWAFSALICDTTATFCRTLLAWLKSAKSGDFTSERRSQSAATLNQAFNVAEKYLSIPAGT